MIDRSYVASNVPRVERQCRNITGMLVACCLSGCRTPQEGDSATQRAGAAGSPSAASEAGATVGKGRNTANSQSVLPPLSGHEWLETLELGSGHQAVVAIPLGAREPRPVVVGVHGAGDRAEWACGGYRNATGAHAFIICPQGLPRGDGKFSTASVERLAKDIELAVQKTREAFGAYVASGPPTYSGFSLGAIRGVHVVAPQGKEFPRVLLVEGGARELSPRSVESFVATGGERVLLLCAAARCDESLHSAARAIERKGARARVVAAGTGRHNLDGTMMRRIAQNWAWLVEGDPRWASWSPPADL